MISLSALLAPDPPPVGPLLRLQQSLGCKNQISLVLCLGGRNAYLEEKKQWCPPPPFRYFSWKWYRGRGIPPAEKNPLNSILWLLIFTYYLQCLSWINIECGYSWRLLTPQNSLFALSQYQRQLSLPIQGCLQFGTLYNCITDTLLEYEYRCLSNTRL